ncbi:MAG: GreA/GreB family elongation factor [Lentisphaeraceae bacterium]|nr:GreA/GreB family elongation factor [Lentisphaeraceae bacterium]
MMSVESLEATLLQSAESKSYDKAIEAVQEIPDKEKVAYKKVLVESGTVLFDDIANISAESIKLAVAVASKGAAPIKVRDYLANAARKVYSTYPDPAGLVDALGCNNKDVAPEIVAGNWQMLSLLLNEFVDAALVETLTVKLPIYCYSQKYGFGKVIEVDPYSDLIVSMFKGRQELTLQAFVGSCQLVIPGTLAATLLDHKKYEINKILAKDLAEELEQHLFPPIKFTQAMLTRILMPKYLKSVKTFEAWFRKRTLAAAAPSKTAAAAGERNWGNSRSLAELKDHLPDSPITPDEEQKQNLLKIFKFAASKPLQVQLYSELICLLWDVCTDKESMKEIVAETSEVATVWQSSEEFVTVTDKMMAKHLNSWFEVTLAGKDADWLVENCLGLPHKYWSYMEKALDQVEGGIDALAEAVCKQIKTGSVSADPIMWMWQRYGKEDHDFLYEKMGNPALIIRTLGREVRGNYIKAGKDLRKLLLEKEEFQKFVMDNGSDNGVSALVSAVRSMTSLDGGEKQSLLVRIVRLYPKAKHLVEKRKVEVKISDMEKLTSVRSYVEKQAELADIINKQIPQNTEAIATARDYGDLRENFEFKAAKDKQKFLLSRRADLEKMLDEIKPTDFTEFTFKDRAIVGSAVELSNGDTYTILGMWDSDPDKSYLSFETPLAKILLGKVVGDDVVLPNGDEATVKSIKGLSDDLLTFLAGK